MVIVFGVWCYYVGGHEIAADSGRFGESSLSNKLDFCYLRREF
ncbi:hypothetical protein QUA86_12730 [Microcoleus sp. F6_B6]